MHKKRTAILGRPPVAGADGGTGGSLEAPRSGPPALPPVASRQGEKRPRLLGRGGILFA
jgi:hypothetical protein